MNINEYNNCDLLNSIDKRNLGKILLDHRHIYMKEVQLVWEKSPSIEEVLPVLAK